jgi:hypothetical protein
VDQHTHKGKHASTLGLTPHRFVCTLSNLSRTPRRPSEISFHPNRQSVGFDKYRGCHSRCVWLKQLVAAVHSSVIYLPSYARPPWSSPVDTPYPTLVVCRRIPHSHLAAMLLFDSLSLATQHGLGPRFCSTLIFACASPDSASASPTHVYKQIGNDSILPDHTRRSVIRQPADQASILQAVTSHRGP